MENGQKKTQVEQPVSKSSSKKFALWQVIVWGIAITSVAVVIVLVVTTFGKGVADDNANVQDVVVEQVATVKEKANDKPQGKYPFTSKRKVTSKDVDKMSMHNLRIMRNEIYARHGYIFDDQELQAHFDGQSWYQPTTKSVTLKGVEKYNVEFIKQFEQARFNPQGKYTIASKRKLTEDDLMRAIPEADEIEEYLFGLRVMRNEIYARYGYIFKDKEMQEYFKKQSWYRPLTNDVKLTKIEKENASFIKKYEDSIPY